VIPGLGNRYSELLFALDPIQHLGVLFRKYGAVVALTKGGGTHIHSALPTCPGTVFTYGAELNRQIMLEHEVFYRYSLAGKLFSAPPLRADRKALRRLATGLFQVNGLEHKAQRRLIMPAFHKERIKNYKDIITKHTRHQISEWNIGNTLDIHNEMTRLTMSIVSHIIFGQVSDSVYSISKKLQVLVRLLVNPIAVAVPLNIPFSPYWRLVKLTEAIEAELERVIASSDESEDAISIISALKRSRLEDGRILTNDELIGHISTLFAAGHETTSSALSWTLYLLSQHPNVLSDLLAEIKNVNVDDPDSELLANLPVLEAVIKESLRILPPAPINARVASMDTDIGGYSIPAGTEIIASIYHTHHNPDYFIEPDRFNPDRWFSIEPSIYEYCPFSFGPRMCIGSEFAKMEMRLILFHILRTYVLELSPRAVVNRFVGITMTPRNGLEMIVRPPKYPINRNRLGKARGNITQLVDLREN
jgi:cytochrome P450